MNAMDQGANPLFMDPDPDKAREFFARKSRAMTDKRMTEKEAVERFIPDGCSFTKFCERIAETWASSDIPPPTTFSCCVPVVALTGLTSHTLSA